MALDLDFLERVGQKKARELSVRSFAKAKRIVLFTIFAKTLRKVQNKSWRREWESCKALNKTAPKIEGFEPRGTNPGT